jgi:thioredoxin reductase (NADPH)
MDPSDILIIGGGPTGLFGAFYAGLRRMRVTLMDSLETLGGQLATLYPEKYIYDVPGFPKVLAKDLVTRLTEQAMQYGPDVHLGQAVTSLEYDASANTYTVSTTGGSHVARTILIAAGIGAFQAKTLAIADARRFEGRGVHYFVKHLDDLRGSRVLVVGGGDSAVDWANTLCPIAGDITLIHRRDGFRAHEDSVRQLRCSRVNVLTFHELRALRGDDRVRQAVIYDNRSNQEQTLDVDAVLVNVGFESSLGPIKEWGLELQGGSITVDYAMRTTRPGIFAAGDVTTYPGKLKLIATGFSEACTAVNFAKHHIDPHARIFPGHSSEMKR